MTTIDDKLKLFANVVLEKVEKDSKQRVYEATNNYDKCLEHERKKILMESQNMVNQMRRKAESEREQILSEANIEGQHSLLKKRKELFDITVEDIKVLAEEFTSQPEYLEFLEKCIKNSISKVKGLNAVLQLKADDIEKYGDDIKSIVEKYKRSDMQVSISPSKGKILGGCICEDENHTMRADSSMLTMIDDNHALIGKTLIDKIGQSR
jgi:V/A-type H+-transporting ATPase subunit E